MSKISVNYRAILRIIGIIIFIIGVSMIIPWVYSEVVKDQDAERAFRICIPITVVLGAAVILAAGNTPHAKFRAREGYIIVAACWLTASIIGAFPFYLSDFTNNYIDAFFESTSGFTTTGCSAAANGVLSDSLLLWKALIHWLGGMGILVFVISILPALGINGHFIAKAETPGPVVEKVTVRMSDSAKILYITYLSLTLMEFVLLMLSGKMNAFDAIVNTMGSISTGGLTVHPDGVAHYDSVYVEIVIASFCILSSINFVLYHNLVSGRPALFFKDIELRVHIIIIFAAVIICTYALIVFNDLSFGSALRESFFQVVSMSTTTGYARNPSIIWPTICQIIFLALLFIGGCAASTSGSLKVIRVIIMMKLIWRGCIKRIHPRSVVAVKLGSKSLSVDLVTSITTFIFAYIGIFILSAFILSFQGLDLESTITITISALSNTGVSFEGPTVLGDFSIFHPLLKLYISGMMIMGRLELFTIIVLFTKTFWGKNR
ncbi:MAG: TrkH family potassium uptake protein [Anaerovoracaceae bacterium]